MVKKIVILGAGESGVGAAILAEKKGLDVFVSDSRKIGKENKKILSNNEIKWEEGGHSLQEWIWFSHIMRLKYFKRQNPKSQISFSSYLTLIFMI